MKKLRGLYLNAFRTRRWVWLTLAGVIVVLTLLSLAFSPDKVFGDMAHWPLRSGVWGTTGQWAGSILTGASFYLAYRVYKGAVERERRAQAALVTFDCKISTTTYRGVVYNHSSSIIRDVHLVVSVRSGESTDRHRGMLTPISRSWHESAGDEGGDVQIIAPVEETQFSSIRPEVEQVFDEELHLFGNFEYSLKLVFTDAAGVRWIRYQDGVLAELRENEIDAHSIDPTMTARTRARTRTRRAPTEGLTPPEAEDS